MAMPIELERLISGFGHCLLTECARQLIWTWLCWQVKSIGTINNNRMGWLQRQRIEFISGSGNHDLFDNWCALNDFRHRLITHYNISTVCCSPIFTFSNDSIANSVRKTEIAEKLETRFSISVYLRSHSECWRWWMMTRVEYVRLARYR